MLFGEHGADEADDGGAIDPPSTPYHAEARLAVAVDTATPSLHGTVPFQAIMRVGGGMAGVEWDTHALGWVKVRKIPLPGWLMIIALAASSAALIAVPPSFAAESASEELSWTTPLPDHSAYPEGATRPNGTYAMQFSERVVAIGRHGSQQWQKHEPETSHSSLTYSPTGDIFWTVRQDDSSEDGWVEQLVASRDGEERWRYSLPEGFVAYGDEQFAFHGDGLLYLAELGQPSSPYTFFVTALDPEDGEAVRRVGVDLQPDLDIRWHLRVRETEEGIAVAMDGGVAYVATDGTVQRVVELPQRDGARTEVRDVDAAADGSVYYATYSSCADSPVQAPEVVRISRDGVEWRHRYPGNDYPYCDGYAGSSDYRVDIEAAPNGRVAVNLERDGTGGLSQLHEGTVEWSNSLADGGGSRGGPSALSTDVDGNIVVNYPLRGDLAPDDCEKPRLCVVRFRGFDREGSGVIDGSYTHLPGISGAGGFLSSHVNQVVTEARREDEDGTKTPILVALEAPGLAPKYPAADTQTGRGSDGDSNTRIPGRYVALGDSFSSGEGAPAGGSAWSGYREGTNTPVAPLYNMCHRSNVAYPALLTEEWGLDLDGTNFSFHACSGATIGDLMDGPIEAYGELHRQIDALEREADLVTVSIGGNDMGFAPVMISCIVTPFCADYDGERDDVKVPFADLKDAYEALRGGAGSPTVVVVGYPQIFADPDDSAYSGCALQGLSKDEVRWIRRQFTRFNQGAAKAAAAAGVLFMDPAEGGELLAGAQLCGDGEQAVNSLGVPTSHSFHPNRRGHELLFAAVRPFTGMSNPEPQPVAEPDPETGSLVFKDPSVIGTDKEGNVLQGGSVRIQGSGFNPHSSAELTLYSKGVRLGEYRADRNGSLELEFTVPKDTPVGLHALEIRGETPGGKSLVMIEALHVKEAPGEEKAKCSSSDIPDAPFSDRSEIPDVHQANVDCAAWHTIVSGFEDGTYRPSNRVRRDQMASFVVRALEAADVVLPEASEEEFQDVAPESPHRESIHRLAEAGIAAGGPQGLAEDEYGPGLLVRRDQMASFLVRAAELASKQKLASSAQAFDDVAEGNVHFRNVNGAAESEIAFGASPSFYRPALGVRRDQMASFVVRLVETGKGATSRD